MIQVFEVTVFSATFGCYLDRAICKQPFPTAQRDRQYHQPEPIDQIMLEKRPNQICAPSNVIAD